ncbi:hypothetical protein PC129_g12900 [Phytophthora cactorum]|uniref:Uncharacterized protein n=1 Tax=Phytophthora cactorum TaxID=29920 RepID=A0A8T0YLI2_9STRA|nr:hypothetical protein PC111_g7148 [Phytophthora cactorum]KAG2851058.1 hypothetical protein PC113_g16243 [Phytophthora cactorum]KAG2894346.1 hypothetical protein PC114_g15943 [Phytophthora cactorum]KAG2924120.1 hypothetical protein PC117_g15467 [Phytophthora cactorum]KAG2969976.1 hypothetical protein PC119_g23762 [Phytophthora cactorum]
MSGFRSRWRELLREGWKSKVPTGLSNDYTYLMPGKTKKDVRGVDFFVGEAELLAYLDRIALEEMKKAATAKHKAKAAANRPTIQSGQPQIGMSNSQGDGGPLSPNADTADTACANEQSSNAAASSSQGDENLTPGVDPAVSTNLAAEVGDEDVDDAHLTRSLNAEFDVAAASGSEYACSEADVNDPNLEIILQTLQHYTRRVKKKASVYDNDEDLGLGEGDSAVEDAAADPDLHFEPSLLEAVGGVGALARGSVHKNVLTDIKFNRWSGPDTQTSFPYTEKPYDERSDA